MHKTYNKFKEPAQVTTFMPHDGAPQELRLYRVVAERIRQLVRREALQPGARLPAERDLATSLNVSRASLREALIALELGGEVEVRGGSGIYISALADADAHMPEAGPGPFELLAARRLFEPEVAAMAARVASDGAIDAMLAAAGAMERCHAARLSPERADRNFHLSIARGTGNGALIGVMEHLWDQRGTLWRTLHEHFRTEQLREESLADHRRIVQAIAAHDPAAAHQAMRAHLERVTRTLSRG
jgi:DNA-binding FadR family transcriptional regulator